MPDVHPISRATRMEIRHSRTPSIPSGPRPNFVRRGSNVSEAGSAITTASEFTEPAQPLHRHLATPMTPSTSSTPHMDPPAPRSGSRRSSFSGSQAAGSPSLSTSAFHGRTGRSPSPIPPLPAIRQPASSTQAIMQRLYGEEGVTRFFRRLSFSPDGSLLLTPAGQIEDQIFKGSPMLMNRSLSHDGEFPLPIHGAGGVGIGIGATGKPKNVDAGKPTVYIYSRANLSKSPVAHLPGHKTSSVAIRFSPIFYDLRTASSSTSGTEPKQITLDKNQPGPIHVSLSMPPPPAPKDKEADVKDKEKEKTIGSIFALPYRLLYAVACQDAVLLYDTQQAGPIAIFKGLHYAGFTDVAW
jgi:chromatin assembly factor 1 subunit B